MGDIILPTTPRNYERIEVEHLTLSLGVQGKLPGGKQLSLELGEGDMER